MFDLQVFDGEGNDIYHEVHQEVDENGRISVKSMLPYTIEIQTTGEDNDFVNICYASQCFSCDDDDGGNHKWLVPWTLITISTEVFRKHITNFRTWDLIAPLEMARGTGMRMGIERVISDLSANIGYGMS